MALVLVHHTANGSNANANTVAVTITSTTAGNLIVVGATHDNASGNETVVSVTDNVGNLYQQVPNARAATGGAMTDVWRCENCLAGATTVTVTYSITSTDEKSAYVDEVSGADTMASVDVTGVGVVNAGSSSATPLGASVTPTVAKTFIVGVIYTIGSISANPHAGNEFTAGGDIDPTSGDRAMCSLITASASAHQPQWDIGSPQVYTSSTVAFVIIQGPTITVQPVQQRVVEGSTATFTITATGSGVLHYQWKKNGSNVGTDSSSYTTAATTFTDNLSTVQCVVTDDIGSRNSTTVYLLVVPGANIAWTTA